MVVSVASYFWMAVGLPTVEMDADGIVGLRGKYSLTPHVYLTGWGLLGGGGADIDWDVAMAIGYEINDRVSAIAGYRALGVDYNDDGFLFDAVQQGPILGLAVRF